VCQSLQSVNKTGFDGTIAGGISGVRSVVAESVLVKQLLILDRSRKRSPNLRPSDRMVAVCVRSSFARAG
jgi:hypothetical protein